MRQSQTPNWGEAREAGLDMQQLQGNRQSKSDGKGDGKGDGNRQSNSDGKGDGNRQSNDDSRHAEGQKYEGQHLRQNQIELQQEVWPSSFLPNFYLCA